MTRAGVHASPTPYPSRARCVVCRWPLDRLQLDLGEHTHPACRLPDVQHDLDAQDKPW